MTYRIAFPLLALALVGGCSASDATDPASPNAHATIVGANTPSFSESFPRAGEIHATKQCLEYSRLAGGFCTIMSSNIPQIEVGSRVVYASDFVPPTLDTDLFIDSPQPGNNQAYGHVILAVAAGVGTVRLSGGTGKFTHFTADVVVTRVGDPALRLWRWDGTYSFDPRD